MPRNSYFLSFIFCDCERAYQRLVAPLVLGFTASSAVVGGVPDVFISSGGEWNFSTNQKAGKRINVHRNYFRITHFASAS